MATDNARLPFKVYLQVRDGVLNHIADFELEVLATRPLGDEEKIAPEARLDHAVRTLDLVAALREAAENLEKEYWREQNKL